MSAKRVVWITGASSGIGAALAEEMAQNGWQVAASGRNPDRLAAVCARAPEAIRAFELDVTDVEANASVATAIENTLGPIDLAVFNAGVGSGFSVDRYDANDVFDRMRVNYGGAVNGIGAVLPAMLERGAGHIALTASVAGFRGLPGGGPYSASKAAMIALAESLKLDLTGRGVDVSVITPGFVRTPLTDKNRFPMPFIIGVDDAARRMRRGLEARRFEITFPRRLSYFLKLLQRLPYALYFPIIRRVAGL
ncbi:short-chain dehydrogenase/reductase SDR [Salinisphaera dokdonensis CL-ES53]|uniref:Short-chain dehydrogenase/reductase SDR n=1 Tax=Salinisphaera dokdonensis CL-ES53 TaxID=1304272 RepID=A0ABV2B1J2_9GAMM